MADLKGSAFSIHIHHGLELLDPVDENVDVEVEFADGSRYAATFFTLENVRQLFEKYQQTGECSGGLYLWSSNMIILKELSRATISATVSDLIAQGEFEAAFFKLS